MDFMNRLDDLYRKHEQLFDSLDFLMRAECLEQENWLEGLQEPDDDELEEMNRNAEELLRDLGEL